jgi:hypothetical protein
MVIYLVGIATLLYLKPSIMFHKDGRWKEFGLGSDETTVFPLWMFCIVWAVISYGFGRLFFKEHTTTTLISAAAIAKNLSETVVEPLPVSGPTAEQPSKPGYYKLNSNVMRKKGVPRYVYVGTEPPADLEDD